MTKPDFPSSIIVKCHACGVESAHDIRDPFRTRVLDRDVCRDDTQLLFDTDLDLKVGHVLFIDSDVREMVVVRELNGHDLVTVDRAQGKTPASPHQKGTAVRIVGIATEFILDKPLAPIRRDV